MTRTALPHLGPGARRWLRRAAWAWGGWLALSTVLLNQPLVDGWINRNPVKFHVGWDVALSPVPGYVTAWGIDLRGQSRGTAFGAHVRRGSAWFVPWALASKTVHLSGAHGSGVALVLRKGTVVLPPAPARQKPWTLLLPGIRFNELWSLRLGPSLDVTGSGRGGLDLRKVLSGGELEIADGRLAWRDLRVQLAGLAVVQDGTVDATLALAPLVTSRSTALQKLRALSLDLALDATLVPLSLDRTGVRMGTQAEQSGELSVRFALASGVVADNARVSLKQPVHFEFEGIRDDRDLALALAVRDRQLVLDATLPEGKEPATTLDAHLQLPLPRLAQLQAAGDGDGTPSLPRYLLGQTSGTVDMSLRFRSLVMIKPWLAKWRGLAADGDGWMHAAVRLDKGRLAEGTQIRFQDATLSASAMDHRLEARADGPLVRVEAGSGRHRLELQQVKLFGPGDLLLLQDAGAQLDLVPQKGDGDVLRLPGLALAIHDADIPDVAVLNAYLPPGAVALGKGRATLALEAALDAEDASANGRLGLRAPAVVVSMGDMRLQGALQVDAALRDADFEDKTLDLAGSKVSLRNVRFDGPEGRTVSGWSMDASVDRARAKVAAPLRVQGAGHIAMSDLRLLLTIYSQISDYPLWILRLADAGKVTAKGRFDLGDGQLRLTGVHAQNERFEVDARLQLGEQARRGALLASWGPLAVAVELDERGSKMHLKGARDWYGQQDP
ncbi:MAG: hypothetical protein KA196_06620 [Arenimonas sp.]|nr:hypothetical protein [Arenimonas sp.]